MTGTDVRPGARIKVIQTIDHRDEWWQTEVEGQVVSVEPRPTGSWFAHGKNDRYWLVRIVLRKDDGELTQLVLDRNTRITVQDGSA